MFHERWEERMWVWVGLAKICILFQIYIDPRTIPNSAVLQAEAEKKNKAMMFYGLAAPIQKLHSADEVIILYFKGRN